MAEELIYSIVFDGTDKSIEAIKSLDTEVARLTGEVNKLNAIKKENGALNDQETKQLIDLKAQIKALNSDRQQQERQLININKSLNAQSTSYNELTTAVNAAKARLKELPIDQTSEEFRQLQQFVTQGTEKLKAFDKAIGDNQRNVGNYPTTFNLATASIKQMEAEIVRLRSVAADLDINTQEFKDTTVAANELETAILKATGKIDEFGNREPKNQTKKAFDDAADSAAGLVAGIQLVTTVLGDEATAEEATAAATKATAIATNFSLLLKAKEAVVDTAALVLKRTKIFLFGEELAATTALNTQTVLMALYQKAAAAATAVATAAATAFGVSVGVATAGISVLVGLLATAAATFFSFGASASTAQKELGAATDESNEKLRQQQSLIDGLSVTNAEIKIELLGEGLDKDLAELNLKREKALADYEAKANEAISAAIQKQNEAEKKGGEEGARLRLEAYGEELRLRDEKNQGLLNLDRIYVNREQDLRKEYSDKEKAENDKKLEQQKSDADERLKKEKEVQDRLNKEFLDGAKLKQEEFEKEQLDLVNRAAEQAKFLNEQAATEKAFYDLAEKLRTNDTDLYFEYLEGNYNSFADFEAKKLSDQQQADQTRRQYDEEYAASVKAHEQDIVNAKQEAAQQAISILGTIANAINQNANDELALIDEQAAKEQQAIDESNLSEEQKAAKTKELQKKTAKEKYEIELKAFNANKAIQAVQATIAGALAIVQALAQLGPIAGAIAAVGIGITTAVQVGTILAAKPPAPPAFAEGGLIKGAGTGKSDSIPAMVSNGESVINARSTAAFAPLLSQINEWGGGRKFAMGGIVSPSSFNQLAESNARGQSFNVINNRIDRLKVIQVEADVSRSQMRVGNIESEATW